MLFVIALVVVGVMGGMLLARRYPTPGATNSSQRRRR